MFCTLNNDSLSISFWSGDKLEVIIAVGVVGPRYLKKISWHKHLYWRALFKIGMLKVLVKATNLYLKLITPNDLDLRPGAVAILIAFVRFSVSEFTDSSPW